MKKVYMIHCWDGTSEDGWYPWIAKKLEEHAIEVIRFDMPNTATPTITEWVTTLDSKVTSLDEDTYFIGHSIGCQTILRYLESKDVKKIGGILFIAPWFDLLPEAVSDKESYDTAYPWIHTPIHLEKIKKQTNSIYCLFSDDDYFVSLEQEKLFREGLNAKTSIISGKGHISADDKVFELKEILDLSLAMLGEKNSCI